MPAKDREPTMWEKDPLPVVVLLLFLMVLVFFTLVWVGGALGAWAYGAGWSLPRWGPMMIVEALQGNLWTGIPPSWIAGGIILVTLVTATMVIMVGVWAMRRWRLTEISGTATHAHTKKFHRRARIKQARRLRSSIANTPAKELKAGDVGMPLGRLARVGTQILGSLEDVVLVIAGPRAGKTSRIVANLVLDATGPTLVTSARYDAYTITVRARQRKGKTYLFDPQGLAHGEQDVWFDLLAAAKTLEGARRLAVHLVRAEEDSNARGGDAFFRSAGRSTLSNMLHAAALDGRHLNELLRWTADQRDRTPAHILRSHDLVALADSLEEITRLPHETQGGVYEHVRQAVQSLYDPDIARWVTPQEGIEELVPSQWVRSTDTLYMLSKNGGGGAAAIIAALTDACFRSGIQLAEANSGRMDPPLLAVLDEAANVCKIDDLPQLYSTLGGFGLTCVTILQNYQQGVNVWGREGMGSLWTAATVKMIGAGLDDYSFNNEVGALVGQRSRMDESLTTSRGGPSNTRSHRREQIMEVADIREMEGHNALMLATSTKPVLLEMPGWFDRKDAHLISRDKQQVETTISRNAQREIKDAR